MGERIRSVQITEVEQLQLIAKRTFLQRLENLIVMRTSSNF